MGMQLASLYAGGNFAVQQELSREKLPPLPIENRVAAEQAESSLPGSQKPQPVDLAKTTSALEQVSLAFNRRLKFVIDQESREVIIKVIDNETDKVIKVLPPEELQRLHGRLSETMGFLFDRVV